MSDDKEVLSGGAVDVSSGEKQGGKCCGCWCDYRRAVFVLSIISLILSILNIINVMVVGLGVPGTPIGEGIRIIVAGISFYGALRYNVAALAVNIAYNCIWFVIVVVLGIIWVGMAAEYDDDVSTVLFVQGILVNIFVTAAICALNMYPAIFLIKEIKAGIMTEETYPREAYSCCCSPNV